MLTLRRALKRKKLFEELDEKWKTAELVLLGQEAFINRWTFKPNYYLVVECAEVDYEGEVFHLIITLDPTQPTKNNNALSLRAERLGFSCWRINLDYFEEMKEFKPLIAYSNFLWKGENNDN